ncbi:MULTISPECIES: ABC transporter substrate-binding protein [Tepidanaerobacter]|uniref:ABC transporter substrate-binding protein n=1 Tax=Tepidanaerobacter TaxID=499228 RepID=UPI000A7A88DE|nr:MULTISPECIES: ABC transporter substrate-binding protein [Tepidanaerobacter]GLI51415.1 putative ABC transporter extracellular-binding protein YurO [Tepidanaerobacter syntrophicus]
MKSYRKTLSLVIIFALALSLVAGCGGGSQETGGTTEETQGEQVVLKFLHKWPQPENMPYFEDVVKDFEATHPNIKIDMEAVADEPIKDKLRVLMGTDSQPDIFFSWSGEFAKKFVRSNNALDITEALNADTDWKNSIMQAGLEPFTMDGKVYGIPFRINGKFFVYNKEIFAKHNLQEPETWADFIKICETLKADNITPIALGNQYPWAACHYLTGLNQKLVPQDVRMKDYNPKTGEFTDPGYVQALEYLKSLNDNGYFNEGVNSTSHDMAHEMFYAGQAAMFYVELEEFQQVEDNFSGKWDFFALPKIPEGKGNQNFLTGAPDGFMISAKTKHPEEAIEFLKFLTSKENSEKLVKDLGWPSPIIGAVNETNAFPLLVEGMKAIEQAEGMALWLDTDVHVKVAEVYLAGLQELLNGSKTPEKIMEEVRQVAKQVQSEVE